MQSKTLLRYALPISLLAALLFVAVRPPPQRVDVETLGRGLVEHGFEAEGRTRVRDRFAIHAPIHAQMRRLLLEPGDPIAAGQVLVVLEPLEVPALDARSLAQAEAAVAGAEARLAAVAALADAAEVEARRAASEHDRLLRLATQGLVAVDAVEAAEAQRRHAERRAVSAGFERAAAEQGLVAARAVLDHGGRPGEPLELRSPVAGVLLRRADESARTVQPGEMLLEVGDPAALEVEVDVLSADAVRLREGGEVALLRWGGDGELGARVRRVDPAGFTKVSALGVEEQRVWVIVDIDSPREHWQRLGDGYRVHARFVLDRRERALRLPQSALFQAPEGGLAVFRVEHGRAQRVPVRVGLRGGRWAEVLEGLAEGDSIVLHPPRELVDGQRIQAR